LTKKEFAARLLFWLLPWPISKILPRSLRIYYWGPAAGPPPGFYDYWGTPGYFWPDAPPLDDFIEDPPVDPPPWWPPDAPPLGEFIENPPVDPPPWWPIDPYNPPPPDQFPEPPSGPTNPSNPYVPGPGSGWRPPQLNPYYPYLGNEYWEPLNAPPFLGSWDSVNQKWDSALFFGQQWISLLPVGGWEDNFKANYLMIRFTPPTIDKVHIFDEDNNDIINVNNPVSGQYYQMDWSANKDIVQFDTYRADGTPFSITSLQMF
jgi:hypothetical protein